MTWDPVTINEDGSYCADLAGYRVYFGTASRVYTQVLDVGLATSATVVGLADCTTWFFGVKSYDTSGNESRDYSAETSGWPDPEVLAAAPAAAEQGQTLNVVLTGANFGPGTAVRFGAAGVTVASVSVASCNQLTAGVSVSASAETGPGSVTVSSPAGAQGTAANLFTVQPATPPEISSVRAVSTGGTTAEVDWSTDEPADRQVFYRKTGQVGYQSTAVDATLATSHAVVLQGLEPSTTYEFHVRSADAGGNAAISSPDGTFATAASSYAYLRFETEGGDLTDPVTSASGTGMFDSGAVTTPAGTPEGRADSPAGRATYGIAIPSAGTWRLWVRVYGQDALSCGWFESVDGAARQAIYPSGYGTWAWVEGRAYSLAAGLHAIELGGLDAEATADRVLLTNDPLFVPTEQPVDDQRATASPSPLAAVPGNARVTLTWTNPRDGDFDHTVVRYRADGKYPTSPADGTAVVSAQGVPGSAGTFVHVGLVNGVTYSYAAFAIDRSGNVSVAARAQATPRRGKKG